MNKKQKLIQKDIDNIEAKMKQFQKAFEQTRHIPTELLADVVSARHSSHKDVETIKKEFSKRLSFFEPVRDDLRRVIDKFYAEWGWLSKISVLFFIEQNAEQLHKILSKFFNSKKGTKKQCGLK